jgi:hypothetical protein
MSNTKRLQEKQKDDKAKRKFRRSVSDDRTADWSTVDMAQVVETIGAVTKAGGALRFGLTVDGGAYAVGVYGDGPEPYTEYVRPNENIESFLNDLAVAFTERGNPGN